MEKSHATCDVCEEHVEVIHLLFGRRNIGHYFVIWNYTNLYAMCLSCAASNSDIVMTTCKDCLAEIRRVIGRPA